MYTSQTTQHYAVASPDHVVISTSPQHQHQQQIVYTQPQPQPQPQQMVYSQPQPVIHAQPVMHQQVMAPVVHQPMVQPVIHMQAAPQPQPVVVIQQQQPQQQPVEAPKKTLSGFDRLNKEGVFIKQKIDIAEVATGCERENSYSIFNLDKGSQKTGVELLRAREKSNWCSRQMLPGGCRPFVMTVQLRDNDEHIHNQPFLELERPCTCSFLCFERPMVNIHHVEGGKRTYLGKLVNPCECNCDLNLEVYNGTNQIVHKVKGDCCQMGVCCSKNPCQQCQTVNFNITTSGGMTVASIQKQTAGYCASIVTTADNWAVTFPNNATVESKALLTCATLFLDYLFFERGGI